MIRCKPAHRFKCKAEEAERANATLNRIRRSYTKYLFP
jgi:hypothetical protein